MQLYWGKRPCMQAKNLIVNFEGPWVLSWDTGKVMIMQFPVNCYYISIGGGNSAIGSAALSASKVDTVPVIAIHAGVS